MMKYAAKRWQVKALIFGLLLANDDRNPTETSLRKIWCNVTHVFGRLKGLGIG